MSAFAKTIIEVGAHVGEDTERLLDGDRNRVFAFEPAPHMIGLLHEKFRGFRNFHLIEKAVDLDEGPRWFNEAPIGLTGVSSLHNFNPEANTSWPGVVPAETKQFEVQTVRLDNFIREHEITTIDYLWIDAQGNDFRVLQSLGSEIARVREGKCETAYTLELYQGVDNDFRTVASWLVDRGFETAVVPEGALKEADVHFRRR